MDSEGREGKQTTFRDLAELNELLTGLGELIRELKEILGEDRVKVSMEVTDEPTDDV